MQPSAAHTARIALIALALAALACSLPFGGAPTGGTTPTQPPPTDGPPASDATTAPDEPWAPPEHRIQIRMGAQGAEFYDTQTGQPFIPRGANYAFAAPGGTGNNRVFQVGVYDHATFDADMARLASYGYNAVRMFTDTCPSGPSCIGDHDGTGLNPQYMDNIADALAVAAEHGIYLQLTSNDLPDQGGYWPTVERCVNDQFAGYRNAHMLTSCGHDATERYWRDFMQALVDRRARFDAVLGWQLLNEQWLFSEQPPLSLTGGSVTTADGQTYDLSDPEQRRRMVYENVRLYIARMRAVIREYDPTAPVTMGFFAPRFPNPTETGGTWYVDTAPLIEDSALDYFDFHGYPGGDIDMPGLAENFGMLGYTAKPVLLGEYGAFTFIYPDLTAAARALTGWAAQACALGFDGYLHWTYYPGGAVVGDGTWGFTDADGYLMDLFAPVNQPDMCEPVPVRSANLAYGQPVTASRALPAEPPENAVDETGSTQWGAGEGPVQWIEVALAEPSTVAEVRLLVAQYPAGDTAHRVELKGAGGAVLASRDLSGSTQDGDWLVAAFDPPLEAVTAVRVTTLSSPSWVAWREVQVFSAPQ